MRGGLVDGRDIVDNVIEIVRIRSVGAVGIEKVTGKGGVRKEKTKSDEAE